MPRPYHRPALHDFHAIGEKWNVHPRTVRRWEKTLGERITDPEAIAEMLVGQRNTKRELLETARKLISP